MKLIKHITFILIIFFGFNINAQKIISNLDSLLSYSASKSATIKSGYLKLDQAKKAKLVAIYGVLDLTGSLSFNIINNTKLPVNLFPAEAFGGLPGTFTEIQSGTKFNSTGNLSAELKLLNLAGWQNLKLSKINLQSTEVDNQLSRKILYENIASAYYNIVSLIEQLKTAQQNTKISDTLLLIVTNKYKQGLAKQQDVNTAEVNYLNSKESVNQIDYLIQQQYIGLKILCDIPESEPITINNTVMVDDIKTSYATTQNELKLNSNILKENIARVYYRQLQYAYLPTVSAFANNANQHFSQEFNTFANNQKWFNSNYIGIKAVLMLPSSNAITQSSKAKYKYLLAKENTTHALLESNLEYTKLNVDLSKAISQYKTNKEVTLLQNDTYYKNQKLYIQGLLSLDQVITSFNAKVDSDYNLSASLVNILLSQSKIDINNKLK